MTAFVLWSLVIAAAWLTIAAVVGYVTGGVIRNRNERG